MIRETETEIVKTGMDVGELSEEAMETLKAFFHTPDLLEIGKPGIYPKKYTDVHLKYKMMCVQVIEQKGG